MSDRKAYVVLANDTVIDLPMHSAADVDRLLALHSRLCLDSSNAFGSSDGRRTIERTPEGDAWLKDYAEYCRLYREINGSRFVGVGPADIALAKAFDLIVTEEGPEAA